VESISARQKPGTTDISCHIHRRNCTQVQQAHHKNYYNSQRKFTHKIQPGPRVKIPLIYIVRVKESTHFLSIKVCYERILLLDNYNTIGIMPPNNLSERIFEPLWNSDYNQNLYPNCEKERMLCCTLVSERN